MIHSTKPKTCAEFECAYYQTNAPVELRPDKCGVMFIKKTERIFTAIKTGEREPTEMALRQIENFRQQGFSVVMIDSESKHPHIALSKGHNSQEIYQEYRQTLWQHIALT